MASIEKKKILDRPIMSGIIVPVGLVILAVVIIFSINRLLTTKKSYKDLVRELHSKTFGNRWVSAFELSKFMTQSKIPPEDIPWFINSLSEIYLQSADPRTRNFLVLALGSLKSPLTFGILEKALKDPDDKVVFNAIVSLGNLPSGDHDYTFSSLYPFLQSKDTGLQQASIFALAQHKEAKSVPEVRQLLKHEDRGVRYAAVTALMSFNYYDGEMKKVLREIVRIPFHAVSRLPKEAGQSKTQKGELYKLRALKVIKDRSLKKALPEVELMTKDKSLKVSTKAKEILNLLKN